MSLLGQALSKSVGPVDAEADAVDDGGDGETVYAGLAEEILEGLPDMVPGTDALQHENDILMVANAALESGVRSVTEFAEWLSMQERHARRSGKWSERKGMAQVDPAIVQLARYVRQSRALKNSLSLRW